MCVYIYSCILNIKNMSVKLEALFSGLLFMQLSKDVKISMSKSKQYPTLMDV